MASAALETVRQFVASLSAGDLATCNTLVADDLVFAEAECLPFGGEWKGKDGLVGMLTAVSKAYRIKLGEPVISDAGDRVLVRVSGSISSRATGRSLPLDAVDVYTVTDGLISRVDVYYKDAAAVAALCDG